jgi:hypothetical protein
MSLQELDPKEIVKLLEGVGSEFKVKVDESAELQETEEDEHTCPLCESALAEELTEEILYEHFDIMAEIINEAFDEYSDDETLTESEKAILYDELIAEAEAELEAEGE